MIIAGLFPIAKRWQPTCPPVEEWIKKMCIYHSRILFSYKKGNSVFCDNMDEPEGQYVKCN
jgi:hypothetical protein